MGDRLRGKNAVVTGAGRGVGRAIALALAGEGASVVVNDPGVERDGTGSSSAIADQVAAEIEQAKGIAIPNYDSVVDFDAAQNIIQTCVGNFGRIDLLVNAAGILRERMIFNMTEEDWDMVIGVHLKGTFNCTRHTCALMRQQRSGRIVNVTSDAWRGTVGQANYGAAKGGIVSFSRAVALEMGRYGVTCNVIAPLAATRMTLNQAVIDGFKKRYEAGLITKERLDAILNMPGPEGVPPIVLYLATDEAAEVNGQVFHAETSRISLYSQPEETKSIYKKKGLFTLDELLELVPKTLTLGLMNPAPPQPPKKTS